MSYVSLTDVTRKARKSHKCIWCGRKITAGFKYQYTSGIFEGDFQSNHWHLACWDASEGLNLDDGFMPYENHYGKVAE